MFEILRKILLTSPVCIKSNWIEPYCSLHSICCWFLAICCFGFRRSLPFFFCGNFSDAFFAYVFQNSLSSCYDITMLVHPVRIIVSLQFFQVSFDVGASCE